MFGTTVKLINVKKIQNKTNWMIYLIKSHISQHYFIYKRTLKLSSHNEGRSNITFKSITPKDTYIPFNVNEFIWEYKGFTQSLTLYSRFWLHRYLQQGGVYDLCLIKWSCSIWTRRHLFLFFSFHSSSLAVEPTQELYQS